MPEISLSQVVVGDNRRDLRGIKQLADSIREIGLLNPITVLDNNRLVAGYHRLEACRSLGWLSIPATIVTMSAVDAELAEIDENLIRNELNVLERSEQFKRRKELYEAKYPDSRSVRERGGPGRGNKNERNDFAGFPELAGTEPLAPAFANDTASKTGVTPRTVQQEVQIAEKITNAVKDLIRETPLADNKTELLRLARMPAPQQYEVAQKIATDEAKGVKQANRQLKAEAINEEPPPLPTGPFRVIVADPPWSYEKRVDDPSHRASLPYPDMSIAEIKALAVPDIAADDCVLWLWTTNAHMRQAFEILDWWGFEHKTILTWVKDRMGTGDWLRGQTEHCLMAVKGKPTVLLTNQTTALHGPLREHSRKPESFYELVETLCPGSKVELFSRHQRDGWAVHGDEVRHP